MQYNFRSEYCSSYSFSLNYHLIVQWHLSAILFHLWTKLSGSVSTYKSTFYSLCWISDSASRLWPSRCSGSLHCVYRPVRVLKVVATLVPGLQSVLLVDSSHYQNAVNLYHNYVYHNIVISQYPTYRSPPFFVSQIGTRVYIVMSLTYKHNEQNCTIFRPTLNST